MMTSSVDSPRQCPTKIRPANFNRADDDFRTRPDEHGDLGPRLARRTTNLCCLGSCLKEENVKEDEEEKVKEEEEMDEGEE